MLPNFKFHHIGFAVFDIEKTAFFYIKNGYNKTTPIIDPNQDIRISFLSKEGEPLIELLEPINEDSPINKTLKDIGVSPYHCCYTVNHIEDAIEILRKERFIVVKEPKKAVALNNKKVCFLYNKNVGLIELLEE